MNLRTVAAASLVGLSFALLSSTSVARGQTAPAGAAGGDAARIEKALQELRRGSEFEANVAVLRRAIDQARDPGALARQIGGALLLDGRYAIAADFLAIARSRLPNDGTVASQLGKAHAQLQHFDEAALHLAAADALLPPGPHPIVKQYLAKALAGQHRFDEAAAMAVRAIDDAKAFNAALAAGRAPLSLAEYELALADVLYAAVRFDEAMAQLERIAALAPTPEETAKAALLRAKILDSRGHEAAALAEFGAARAATPQGVEAWYESAAFLLRRQRHAEAKPLLEKVVLLDPEHEGAWFSLARVLPRCGDAPGGKAAMARYAAIHAAKLAADERLTELQHALATKQ